MPEGDTIHRTAARLATALEGRALARVELARWAGTVPGPGELVTSVDAVGKHLLVAFSGGRVLHTHMRMTGSWHLYATGERWRRARSRMRAVVAVEGWEAVCFDAPVVRLVTPGGLRRELAHLGPDLTGGADDAAVAECVARIDRFREPATPLVDVLLDQRVCCGVGNVYKSEVCWMLGLDPHAPVGELAGDERAALVSTASQLLAANLDRARRSTVAQGLAVYGRSGRPCRRCGAPVVSASTGERPRVTYWCPGCQVGSASRRGVAVGPGPGVG